MEQDFKPKLQTSKNLNYLKTLRSESKEFLNKHLLMMEIYITYHLQILSFSSRFRRFWNEKFSSSANHSGRQYLIIRSPPQNFFHFYGPVEENKLAVLIKRNYFAPFHFSYSLLINCWKTTKTMTLKFSNFQFVSFNCFVKNWP